MFTMECEDCPDTVTSPDDLHMIVGGEMRCYRPLNGQVSLRKSDAVHMRALFNELCSQGRQDLPHLELNHHTSVPNGGRPLIHRPTR